METKTFNGFNNFLGTFEEKIIGEYNTLNNSNEYFKNQPDATPYKNNEYTNIFDHLDDTETTLDGYVSKMTEINQNIERIINKIRDFKSLIMEVKQSVNNQNFRSGLKGQITQTIRQQPDANEIMQSLPGQLVDSMNMGYVDAPFKSKGGKKNKKRNTKRKTLKVHKHKFRRN